MELIEAIRTRRSSKSLTEPAPSDDEVRYIVELAATSPDHGLLRPWRLVLLRDGARERLGEAFASAEGETAEVRRRAALKPLRAPLLVAIVFCPTEHPKVPQWEQMAAACAMVQTILLLLHDRGWGAMWRTGSVVESLEVQKVLGVQPDEKLLGWLYVGTNDQSTTAPRKTFDVRSKVSVMPKINDKNGHRTAQA